MPERYAEVKSELEAARTAFDEERYADAIAAVKDVPAHAEALAKESLEAQAEAPCRAERRLGAPLGKPAGPCRRHRDQAR